MWRETQEATRVVELAIFQSTPSVWRETPNYTQEEIKKLFQSTPSVWRETIVKPLVIAAGIISIHSLRVEGDNAWLRLSDTMRISIHSLRVEGDDD